MRGDSWTYIRELPPGIAHDWLLTGRFRQERTIAFLLRCGVNSPKGDVGNHASVAPQLMLEADAHRSALNRTELRGAFRAPVVAEASSLHDLGKAHVGVQRGSVRIERQHSPV